jgi:hypothetical protein
VTKCTRRSTVQYAGVRRRLRSIWNAEESRRCRERRNIDFGACAEVTLALVAAALAATAATWPGVAAWAAVVTTASGAMAAYIASERYEFLWIEYSRTASELRRFLDRRAYKGAVAMSEGGVRPDRLAQP